VLKLNLDLSLNSGGDGPQGATLQGGKIFQGQVMKLGGHNGRIGI
jgi:hypothetical protein